MNVLVTGGLGYIGSHTIIQLLHENYDVTALDNLSNSSLKMIKKIESISRKKIKFYEGDIRDDRLLDSIFREQSFDAVLHFAGLKSVYEATKQPVEYYENNVVGSIKLLECMKRFNVKTIIFSSSATVYGNIKTPPFSETMTPGIITNPYGRSKLFIENILNDIFISDTDWRIGILRYFNPGGAHKSGLIGENPNGKPNNLLPYVSQTAIGIHQKVYIYGGDYPTKDGTGIRDYIHIEDLASGHLKALEKCKRETGIFTINLGTGRGYSVLEVIKVFERVSGKKISFEIVERRPGDISECYADPTKAKTFLNWETKYNLEDICSDIWKWESLKTKN